MHEKHSTALGLMQYSGVWAPLHIFVPAPAFNRSQTVIHDVLHPRPMLLQLISPFLHDMHW